MPTAEFTDFARGVRERAKSEWRREDAVRLDGPLALLLEVIHGKYQGSIGVMVQQATRAGENMKISAAIAEAYAKQGTLARSTLSKNALLLKKEREEIFKQHWQRKREEAEQEVRENKLWAANKLYEALTKACKSKLFATLDQWTNVTESGCKRSDPVFRAWLQEGMPIKCISSGAYLSSMPSVYKCIEINPRRWALCDIRGSEFAQILNQALRDERDKRIAFPTFITAEGIRKYLEDLCALKPLARSISKDAPKHAVVKRKR